MVLADESLEELPRSDAPRNAVARLKKTVKGGNIAKMSESNSALHAFIDDLQIELGRINNEIARTYFHIGESAQAQTQTQSAATA